jgi:hypothetical protein
MPNIPPLSTLSNQPNYKNVLGEENYYDAQENLVSAWFLSPYIFVTTLHRRGVLVYTTAPC